MMTTHHGSQGFEVVMHGPNVHTVASEFIT